MTLSLNEIEARAKYAGRGAGWSWGLAEEAARGVRWLAAHDLDGASQLSALLTQNDGLAHAAFAPIQLSGEWSARGGVLCPIVSGAALNDCADLLAAGQTVTMTHVSYPLLVLPFAAWVASHIGQPVKVSWQDVSIVTDGEGIAVSGECTQLNSADTERLVCAVSGGIGAIYQTPKQRGSVPSDVWDRLNVFAQRTYAPATDASRELGAGAGLSDND